MEERDWTNNEYLSNLTAEELGKALQKVGLSAKTFGDEEGVIVHFETLADAESLMTLAVGGDETLGGLYDRATDMCLSLIALEESGLEENEAQGKAEVLLDNGWNWRVHPAMTGRRMGWHVGVTIPVADANQITANLNAFRLGGGV